MDKIYKFEEVRQEIIDHLNVCREKLGITEPIELVDGFINQPYSMNSKYVAVIGGPYIPMIVLLGLESGRIYFFSLLALLNEKQS